MKKALILIILIYINFNIVAQNVEVVKIDDLIQIIDKDDDITRVVNFWATWCRPCVAELPHFEEAHKEYKDKKVELILVAIEDDKARIEKFIQKKGITAKVLYLDEKDANAWIPKINNDWDGAIPVTLFVNNKLKKRDFHSGQIDKEELFKTINQFNLK